jgi:nucleotide-binding universal stress UspA family protein
LKQEVSVDFAPGSNPAQLEFDVLQGPLLDRFLEFAAEKQCDVAMVGHGAGHSGRKSLARRLAMKAPCSIWMVPEGSRPHIRRILVPTDFSEHSADTLHAATALAAQSQAECIVLHVYFNEATTTFEEYDQVLRGEEQKHYERFIAGINCHGVQLQPLFVESPNIGHTICRVALEKQADLIVMPCRGRSRSAAILLGSVAEETIIETKVPLLVVKHFGARLGLLQVLLDRSFRTRTSPRSG